MSKTSSGRRLRWPILLVIALAILPLLGLAEAWRSGPIWRALYPNLPPRVQGLPYQLRARLPASESTPPAIPTARAVAASPAAVASLVPEPRPLHPTQALATPTTSPMPVLLPPSVRLDGLVHAYQTWNNCGPATLSMALSVNGVRIDQAELARGLKPDPDDKNVGLAELAEEARRRGLVAELRYGGDAATLRRILAAGYPVIVETWFVPEPGDEMGHYRLLLGYEIGPDDETTSAADEASQDPELSFIVADSYQGPDLRLSALELDEDWRAFNHAYLWTYLPEQGAEAAILAASLPDGRPMFEIASRRALAEIERNPQDAFAWFNLGSSSLALGDHQAAASAYDQARAIGLPWRMLWYQHGPFEAYAALERWAEVEALARANLAGADNLEESWFWLSRALEAQGQSEAAGDALARAQTLNPLRQWPEHWTAP